MNDSDDRAAADPGESSSAGPEKPVYKALRLCTNFRAGYTVPSCGARGAKEVAAELERQWPERDLPFVLETVHCMGKCHIGPTMKLIPAGPYIMGARTREDVTRILDLLEAGEAEQAAREFALPEPV